MKILPPRACLTCGTEYQPSPMQPRQKYCRRACRDGKSRDTTVYPIGRVCGRPACGKTFLILTYRQKVKLYCSATCAVRTWNEAQGHAITTRRNNAAWIERPFTFTKGRMTRPERCEKCGSGTLIQEPALTHCLMCGSLWPIAGIGLREQLLFEVASGLRLAGGGARFLAVAEQGTYGDAHE